MENKTEYYKNFSLENILDVDENGNNHLEIWKSITDYENYQVSNLGRFKSLNYIRQNRESILKQDLSNSGYLRISMCKNRKGKAFLSHRLVALYFIENTEKKPQVNHKKGIKTDNRFHQLEWNTRNENMKHSFENKFHFNPKGENSRRAKLTNKEVLEIRQIGKSKKQKQIGKIYNITFQTVSQILNRKSWKHI